MHLGSREFLSSLFDATVDALNADRRLHRMLSICVCALAGNRMQIHIQMKHEK